MPPLDAVFAVILAGFALSATPGPSMLYVASRSIGQNRSAGLASALGLGFGGVILAIATAFGLAAVFAEFKWVVLSLKYVGSTYLVWLGVDMIRNARKAANVALDTQDVESSTFSKIFWQGVMVELLNPKTVLFFALFLPPFVEIGSGQFDDRSVQLQLLALGVLVPLTAVPSDILVAVMGGTLTRALGSRQVLRERLAWGCGLILVAIALNLLFEFW